MSYPKIIQGGMGVAVSSWPLASAVARRGHLGVVSGTGLDTVFVRRLQTGDVGGHIREALSHFPVREIAERVWDRYFVQGGKSGTAAFKSKPLPAMRPAEALLELTVVANFVEVFLAKRSHTGLVGMNLLEKIQLPTLPSLFGAMLAGVDYVLMGAGIPRAIPSALDSLADLKPTELKLDVSGAMASEEFVTRFDPGKFSQNSHELKRPNFLAIVSSSTLAMTLARKCRGKVDGFVVEGKTAGGHNAPPRGALTLDESGEPIYGPRDDADLEQIRDLGLPFWLAGSFGIPGKLQEALDMGAQGIQVGTAFAFCRESGMAKELRERAIRQSIEHQSHVFTDPFASPTGFPFKVLEMEGTLSEQEVYEKRGRICDLGYLRELYRKDDGTVGYRCPGEPVEDYIRKGGDVADTMGRNCICNALLATVGLGQVRKGVGEPAIITAGDEVRSIAQFLRPGHIDYSADDVIARLLADERTDEEFHRVTILWAVKEARFESLVRKHKDAVYRQMARVCENREDAEDALASALMLAFQASDQLESEDAFRTWLGTIGKRVCTRMRSRPAIQKVLEFAEQHGLVDNDTSEFDMTVLKGCVRDAVNALPHIYRAVYEKCELDEATVPQAAAEIGITHAAAKSRLLRARAIVRESLDHSVCAP